MLSEGSFKKIGILLAVVMVAAVLCALPGANPAGAAGSPADSAVQYLNSEYTTRGLVNTEMGVGAYAFYVLRQAEIDVSAWEYDGVSLDEAVTAAISGDLAGAADPSAVSAKRLAQDLAAAVALEDSALTNQLEQALRDRESDSGFDNNVYSDIPAYDLLGRTNKLLSVVNAVYAKDSILAAQNTTAAPNLGSFGSVWGAEFFPDFMTTAQAVRALHYLDRERDDSEIQTAIEAALNWLKDTQQADGSFLGSEWDDPVTDTAEIIITLTALDLDPAAWPSSSGKTAVDYMMNNALNDDGSFGSSRNVMDAIWALSAYNLIKTQFYLDPAEITLNAGRTFQLKAVWQYGSVPVDVTSAAQWSSADTAVAAVESGLVTALTAGKTEITAVYDGLTALTKVAVDSSSSGGEGGTRITVGLAVVGQENRLLYGPAQISVDKSNKWGLTALGALDASGLDYGTSSWSYGDLVDYIEGQANVGLSGWMFTVNDKVPGSGADKYNIKANDRIIFYYSSSMDQQPPKWGELGNSSSSGGGGSSSAGSAAPFKDSDLDTAIKNARAAGLVALAADDKSVSLTLSREQIAKIHDAGFPLAVTIQGAKFILSLDGLKVKELSTDKAAHMKFSASKLGSDDVRKLTESFAAGLRLAGEIYELNIQVLNKDGTSRDIANLTHCLVLLPLPEGLEENAAGLLKAYRYNEAGRQWEDAGGTYDPDNGAVGFQVEHFSKYALLEAVPQTPEKVVFNDIIGHWARSEIEYMAAAGYVDGVGENQFSPETKITRAEFTAILVRLAGLEPGAEAAECFADVPADAWYRGLVGAAARAGLVLGASENSFAPDELVTREQMAVILVRFMTKNDAAAPAAEAGEAGLLSGFGDSGEISFWARTSVAQAVKGDLMAGRDAGRFAPRGGATRAEATVVLYRALQKLPPVNPETAGH